MKNTRNFAPRLLVATIALGALGFAQTSYAQPEAPAPNVGKAGKAGKRAGAGKKQGKKLTPRMAKAIEAQTGKPLTPEVKDQLTTALRAREAAVKAANETFYAAMAQATGLTQDQAKAIDKPGGKNKMTPAAPATPATGNAQPMANGAQ